MSKNCQNCRHFQWLPKPWSADQTEAVWECKLGKDLEILDKMDTHISGVTWIGDAGRNTDLQCELTARECDSYEGRSCQQCKHFFGLVEQPPDNQDRWLTLDYPFVCKLGMLGIIIHNPCNPENPINRGLDTVKQVMRYCAKRCEEYSDGNT